MTIVYGAGRTPNDILLCGEAPGKVEASIGKPFAGPSGREQEWYLGRHNLSAYAWYRTNVVKDYIPKNPDPTPELIAKWSPLLLREVHECNPRVIVTAGRFAARFFLGDDADMDRVHGLAHEPGCFDPARKSRAPEGSIIFPVYHPAFGLHDSDRKYLIASDYDKLAVVLSRVKRGLPVSTPHDDRSASYLADVTGKWLAKYLSSCADQRNLKSISIDTEGIPSNPWSVQVSCFPDSGYVLRCSDDNFADGMRAIVNFCRLPRVSTVFHNAPYDISMMRAMGGELRSTAVRIIDSQYAAYLLRTEPQSLKSLAWRWCGIRMREYEEVVGDAGIAKQLVYLSEVTNHKWNKPVARTSIENDGTAKIYTPQSVEKTADRILSDFLSGKVNKDGEKTDIRKRWIAIDGDLREQVTSVLGPMPIGTLADIPLKRAVDYSALDAVATIRVWPKLEEELERRDLLGTMARGMQTAPIFEEMQSKGMPASRVYFQNLYTELNGKLAKMGQRISNRYYNGRPFNPNSSKQVAVILRRRGLIANKRTKSGTVSTGKQSIEHLRFTDVAISNIFDWREMAHIRDAFCKSLILDRIPRNIDIAYIRCKLNTTRTHTRRLSSVDPNLLAIPARTELGRRVRAGFIAPPGMLFGSWDFSQIEMRYMAHVSRDARLIEFFCSGKDIHYETAAIIFDRLISEVTDDQRTAAKTANFGIIYGLTARGLLTRLQMMGAKGWTVDKCQKMIDGILHTFQGVADFIESTIRQTRKKSYVRDHSGMYRYLPAINHYDGSVAAEAGRMAVSQIVQGGAQTLIQDAMNYLREPIEDLQDVGFDVSWALQVHDEDVLLFESHLWPRIDKLVLNAFRHHHGMKLLVPIEAKGHCSQSWGGLKAA